MNELRQGVGNAPNNPHEAVQNAVQPLTQALNTVLETERPEVDRATVLDFFQERYRAGRMDKFPTETDFQRIYDCNEKLVQAVTASADVIGAQLQAVRAASSASPQEFKRRVEAEIRMAFDTTIVAAHQRWERYFWHGSGIVEPELISRVKEMPGLEDRDNGEGGVISLATQELKPIYDEHRQEIGSEPDPRRKLHINPPIVVDRIYENFRPQWEALRQQTTESIIAKLNL